MTTRQSAPAILYGAQHGREPITQVFAEGAPVEIVATDEFGSPACRALKAYWHSKRGDHKRPAWKDLSLMEIHELVPKIMVKDVIEGGEEFRNRYWGTDLTFVLGLDATGCLIRDYLAPDRVESALDMYRLAMQSDLPVRKRGSSNVRGKGHISFEEILLAVDAPDHESVAHVITLFDFQL